MAEIIPNEFLVNIDFFNSFIILTKQPLSFYSDPDMNVFTPAIPEIAKHNASANEDKEKQIIMKKVPVTHFEISENDKLSSIECHF